MIKNYTELKKGDILSIEYGCYNNYVTVIFEKYEVEGKWVHIFGRFLGTNERHESYATIFNEKCKFNVIGSEGM